MPKAVHTFFLNIFWQFLNHNLEIKSNSILYLVIFLNIYPCLENTILSVFDRFEIKGKHTIMKGGACKSQWEEAVAGDVLEGGIRNPVPCSFSLDSWIPRVEQFSSAMCSPPQAQSNRAN